MEEISRLPDTRDSLSRWNGSQVEALTELSWQGPVAFHFTRGSCTLLSPAIKRDFFFLQQMETMTEIITGKNVETEYLWGSP